MTTSTRSMHLIPQPVRNYLGGIQCSPQVKHTVVRFFVVNRSLRAFEVVEKRVVSTMRLGSEDLSCT